MPGIYWSCLAGGVLFAVVTIVFGELIGHIFHGLPAFEHLDFLQPVSIIGGITVFGGTGIMLSRYTSMGDRAVLVFSLTCAVLAAMLIYFAYVRPMKSAENSTGFSMRDLVGKIGEVTVTIPVQGYGEVLLRVGAGNTNQIAAGLDGEELVVGTQVVVADVKEGTVYVFRYEDMEC